MTGFQKCLLGFPCLFNFWTTDQNAREVTEGKMNNEPISQIQPLCLSISFGLRWLITFLNTPAFLPHETINKPKNIETLRTQQVWCIFPDNKQTWNYGPTLICNVLHQQPIDRFLNPVILTKNCCKMCVIRRNASHEVPNSNTKKTYLFLKN